MLYLEDTTCRGCGGDLHQTLQEGWVYDVDTDTVCHSCAALELVSRDDRQRHEKDKPTAGVFAHEHGRIYTVRPLRRYDPANGD